MYLSERVDFIIKLLVLEALNYKVGPGKGFQVNKSEDYVRGTGESEIGIHDPATRISLNFPCYR
jgi:hypothetical protein